MYKKTKKLLAWALVVCLVLTQMVFANVAMAAERYEGADRYETAAKIAEEGWADGSEYAVLAYGGDFPDALAASPLAKAYDAPILLTEKDELNADAEAALEDLGVETVFIIGGVGVVSQKVEEAVEEMGITVERLFGQDRLETSVAIAEAVEEKLGEVEAVVLATAYDFPDALSISPIAAAKGWPILLTEKGSLSAEVEDFIGDKMVYVVGGSGVVSNAAVAGLDYERLGGADRFDTNVAIMEAFADDLDFDLIYLATAYNFPDALAGSALAAQTCSPIVLVGSSLDSGVKNFLKANASPETEVVALGGTGVVGSSVVSAVEAALDAIYVPLAIDSVVSLNHQLIQVKFNQELEGELNAADFTFDNGLFVTGAAWGADHTVVNLSTTSQTNGVFYALRFKGGSPMAVQLVGTTGIYNSKINVTPKETVALMKSVEGTTDANYDRGKRTLTVTISDLVGQVDLALIPAGNYNATDNEFTDDDEDGLADAITSAWRHGSVNADIEEINGVPVLHHWYKNNVVVPSNGVITVSIDNLTYNEKVRLVAFQDANANDKLEVNDDGVPTEMAGVSGVTAWHNGGAAYGQAPVDAKVFMILKDINVFTDQYGKAYTYDSGDTYRLEDVGITEEDFEKVLCKDDPIAVAYNTAASGVSVFDLAECYGYGAPGKVTVYNWNKDSGSKINDVKVVFDEDAKNASAIYIIKRASLTGPDGYVNTIDDLDPVIDKDRLEWRVVGTTDESPYYDYNVADGKYVYRVDVENPVSKKLSVGDVSDIILVPQANNFIAPEVLQATVRDINYPGQVDAGDVWYILFNDEMSIQYGDILRVRENWQGFFGYQDFANIVLGQGNTFTVTPRGGQSLLTITFTATPALANPGNMLSNQVLEYGDVVTGNLGYGPKYLYIEDQTGITDILGNNLAAQNCPVVKETVAPYIVGDILTDATFNRTIKVWFNEALDVSYAADKAHYTVTGANGIVNPITNVSVSTSSTIINGTDADGYAEAWTVVEISVQNHMTIGSELEWRIKDLVGNEAHGVSHVVVEAPVVTPQ